MTKTPDWFDALFRELAMALQPRDLKPDTRAVYFEVLAQLPQDRLRAAVATLKRGRFFPTSGEWYAVAMRAPAPVAPTPQRADCARCHGRGLIVVRYHCGEPFDLAICDCDAAQPLRSIGFDGVRQFVQSDRGGRIRLTDANRIGYLEDFAQQEG